MKTTFDDFIMENKNCSGYENNKDMQELFDKLNADENIIKMIEFSDRDKPALAACAVEIEKWYDSKVNCGVDLKLSFPKTAVGNLVKSILKPFGYKVIKQKDLPKDNRGKYFKSASCYKYDENAIRTMQIVKTVVEIK